MSICACFSIVLVSLILPARAFGIEEPAKVLSAEARAGEAVSPLTLPGTVVASKQAVIASEQAGAVVELRVRVGDRVSSGTVLARLRKRPLELQMAAARSELAEAEARRSSEELRWQRLEQLQSSEVVSRQNVDDARFEMQAAVARVGRLEAEIERLADALERTVVRAPFAGVVVAEKTQVGEWLEPGDPVVELMSVDDLEAKIDVPEAQFPFIEPGMRVVLTGPARPGEEVTTQLNGEIRAVVPRAATGSRTFSAFVRFLHPPEGVLGAGASVDARVEIGGEAKAIWVPQQAVVSVGGRSLVYRLAEDSTVELVDVELKDRGSGVWRAVEGALEEGDLVLTAGHESIRDGERVAAQRREYPWP